MRSRIGCHSGRALRREDIPAWLRVDEQGRIWTSYWRGPERRAEWRQASGYLMVKIRQRDHYAHRVVFAWFFGEAPAGQLVRHRNHVKVDNRPKNLSVGSNAANMADMKQAGRSPGGHIRGERNHNAKLTVELVRELRTEHAAGASQLALAAKYGIRQATVWSIVHHKTWAHVA